MSLPLLLACLAFGAVLARVFIKAMLSHTPEPTSPELERLRRMEPRTPAQRAAYLRALNAERSRIQAEVAATKAEQP